MLPATTSAATPARWYTMSRTRHLGHAGTGGLSCSSPRPRTSSAMRVRPARYAVTGSKVVVEAIVSACHRRLLVEGPVDAVEAAADRRPSFLMGQHVQPVGDDRLDREPGDVL